MPSPPAHGADQAVDLIVLGASARAAARSAIRAGHRPWCSDLFADRDLCAVAPVERCPARQYPDGLLRLMRRAPAGPRAPVLLTGALENHPAVIEAIGAERPLVGSSARTVRQVRDPTVFARLPSIAGLRPDAAQDAARVDAASWHRGARYLLKPRRGTGGRGVRFWVPGDRIDADHYLQRYVEGTPIGAVYAGRLGSVRFQGATVQVIGDRSFGAERFRYCGSLGPLPLRGSQRRALECLGAALCRRHALAGPFGVDAVIDASGAIWPVEINPRYTASIEVLERATGEPVLDGPADAPAARDRRPSPHRGVQGKAIVFARRDTPVGDLYEQFDEDQIADVPRTGELIKAGSPICTLLAHGGDEAECLEHLRAMARRLYERAA